MVTITFEAHGTTLDNEAGLASGHYNVELTELGKNQARELGERYKNNLPDMVFCSQLKRSSDTGKIAFGNNVQIIIDPRLSEIDYGQMTRKPNTEVKHQKTQWVKIPFPSGQSYEQTTARVKSFLQDLLKKYDGKTVVIIGHRATQYALEHLINHVPLEQAVETPWVWQPGWEYKLKRV